MQGDADTEGSQKPSPEKSGAFEIFLFKIFDSIRLLTCYDQFVEL